MGSIVCERLYRDPTGGYTIVLLLDKRLATGKVHEWCAARQRTIRVKLYVTGHMRPAFTAVRGESNGD